MHLINVYSTHLVNSGFFRRGFITTEWYCFGCSWFGYRNFGTRSNWSSGFRRFWWFRHWSWFHSFALRWWSCDCRPFSRCRWFFNSSIGNRGLFRRWTQSGFLDCCRRWNSFSSCRRRRRLDGRCISRGESGRWGLCWECCWVCWISCWVCWISCWVRWWIRRWIRWWILRWIFRWVRYRFYGRWF